jgi:hypothetical protein
MIKVYGVPQMNNLSLEQVTSCEYRKISNLSLDFALEQKLREVPVMSRPELVEFINILSDTLKYSLNLNTELFGLLEDEIQFVSEVSEKLYATN